MSLLLLFGGGGGIDQGVNFRSTLGYVTDNPNEIYCLAADTYPTTRGGVTFGWVITGTLSARDRNASADRRLAGVHFTDNVASYFRFDMPAGAGKYAIHVAAGDISFSNGTAFDLQDTTTTFASTGNSTAAAGSFKDANNVERTAAQWPTYEAPLQRNFSTGQFRLKTKNLTFNGAATIAHLRITALLDATGYILSGPAQASAGVASPIPFVATLNGYNAGTTITPNDGSAGGSFSPTSFTTADSGPLVAQFTYTPPTLPQTVTLACTNNGGLTNPAGISCVVKSMHVGLIFAGLSGNTGTNQLVDMGPYKMEIKNRNFSSTDPVVQQYAAINNLWGAQYNTHNSHSIDRLSWGFASLNDVVNTGFTLDTNIDGAGNSGFWVCDATNAKLNRHYLTGALVGAAVDISAVFGPLGTNALQGVAYDASDDTLWCTAFNGGHAYHFTKAGVRITGDEFTATQLNQCTVDPATDKLWLVSAATGVKAYSLATGSNTNTFAVGAGSQLDGIAFDTSDNTLWITDDQFHTIRHLDLTGGNVSPAGFTIIDNVEGIAIVGSDLWVSHDRTTNLGNRLLHYTKAGGYVRGLLTDSYTMSAWVYSLAAGFTERGIMGDRSNTDHGSLSLTATSGAIKARTYKEGLTDGGGHTDLSDSTAVFNTTGWHHVCTTWDKDTGLFCLYRDGILTASGTCTTPKLGVDSTGFQIAGFAANASGWDGHIAAPLVANRAWLIEEVQAAANSASSFYTNFPDFFITGATGAFVESGKAATALAHRYLTGAVGTFAEAGRAATILPHRYIVAALGTYIEAGQVAGINATRYIIAALGTYALAGQDASILAHRYIVCSTSTDVKTFNIAGQAATINVTRLVPCAAGTFNETGNDASIIASRYLTCAVGVFTEAGQAASFTVARKVIAATGVYQLAGGAAGFAAAGVFICDGGNFTLTGKTASTLATRRIVGALGTYIVTGNAADIIGSGGTTVAFAAIQTYYTKLRS